MDFTLSKYSEFLRAVRSINMPVYGISRWLDEKPFFGLLIRHDVDRLPENSLSTAELEAENEIFTTYFFRITPNSFNPKIIEAISKLGHEIGYHYENLAVTRGDFEQAEEDFKNSLERLRKHAKIKTIAMHGSPMSKFDNRDLWQKADFKKYGIESEAFLSIDYKGIYYFTDTGRSWSNKSVNLRDKMECLQAEVSSTDELIGFLKKNKSSKIAITTHPERWNDPGLKYLFSFGSDMIVNSAKRILQNVYKLK